MEEYRDDKVMMERPKNLKKIEDKAYKLIKEKEKPKIKPKNIFKDYRPKGKSGKCRC